MSSQSIPFQTDLLKPAAPTGSSAGSHTDSFSALYRDQRSKVRSPIGSETEVLKAELIPSKLEPFRKHIWAIGGKHAAVPLNYQIAFGREIIVWEDINLHLVWNGSGKIFIKPLPRFLLDSKVWREQLNSPNPYNTSPTASNARQTVRTPPSQGNASSGQSQSTSTSTEADYLRSCAVGFLYTYICLITHESDFAIAKEKKLLPLRDSSKGTEIDWDDWKRFSREVLSQHSHDNTHWRFQRGELRLTRLNFFSRFTQFPLFTSYIRGWRGYGSLVRDNVTWLVTATVFIALVLTALQVGLATDLGGNKAFKRFSYGFSVFAVVASVGAFFVVLMEVVYNIVKDNLRYRQKNMGIV